MSMTPEEIEKAIYEKTKTFVPASVLEAVAELIRQARAQAGEKHGS